MTASQASPRVKVSNTSYYASVAILHVVIPASRLSLVNGAAVLKYFLMYWSVRGTASSARPYLVRKLLFRRQQYFFSGEGIEVSEAEMVPLCLTDYAGTPTLGLYRGVKLIANRHGQRVVLLDGGFTRLVADDDWPVLVSMRLPFDVEDRRYVEQWGIALLRRVERLLRQLSIRCVNRDFAIS